MNERQRPTAVMEHEIPLQDSLSDQSAIEISEKSLHFRSEKRGSNAKGKEQRGAQPHSSIYDPDETQECDHRPTLKKITGCAKHPFGNWRNSALRVFSLLPCGLKSPAQCAAYLARWSSCSITALRIPWQLPSAITH